MGKKSRQIESLQCRVKMIEKALTEARVANFIVIEDYVPGVKLDYIDVKKPISLEDLLTRIKELEKAAKLAQKDK